jgi:hypothetical protein
VLTNQYVLERLHEIVERAMQRVAVTDSTGKPIGQYGSKATSPAALSN